MIRKYSIPVFDEWGNPIGQFDTSGYHRLPALILCDGRYFQRYGKLGAYRYCEETIHPVEPHLITYNPEQS